MDNHVHFTKLLGTPGHAILGTHEGLEILAAIIVHSVKLDTGKEGNRNNREEAATQRPPMNASGNGDAKAPYERERTTELQAVVFEAEVQRGWQPRALGFTVNGTLGWELVALEWWRRWQWSPRLVALAVRRKEMDREGTIGGRRRVNGERKEKK
ncbi:hypothetical protein E2542_SST05547 [Spatholobus suberectus]|nr:hypothetical protein E2542_SST05547 [Spatholobus suberectus]